VYVFDGKKKKYCKKEDAIVVFLKMCIYRSTYYFLLKNSFLYLFLFGKNTISTENY